MGIGPNYVLSHLLIGTTQVYGGLTCDEDQDRNQARNQDPNQARNQEELPQLGVQYGECDAEPGGGESLWAAQRS